MFVVRGSCLDDIVWYESPEFHDKRMANRLVDRLIHILEEPSKMQSLMLSRNPELENVVGFIVQEIK